MPGIIPMIDESEPIFLIALICLRKSSKSNLFLRNFSSSFSASSSSIVSWAFSTSETISPLPRILDASLSG
jgi:hypothetical protein